MRSRFLDFSEVVINTQDDTTYDVDLSKRIVSSLSTITTKSGCRPPT